ncbi:MAG: 3D domain-containing protein [Phycisphaerales bacterium]|nr:3D domain-containing protein [Phycisphaerales bacterium]
MIQPVENVRRRTQFGRAVMELAIFCAAAGVVAWSAATAKRWQIVDPPMLAAVDTPDGAGPAASPDVRDPLLEIDDEAAAFPQQAADGSPAGVPRLRDVPGLSAAAVGPPSGFERYFDGRPLRRKGTIRMKVTAYSPDWRSCGESADGWTSTMRRVETNAGRMVAADPRVLPYGSLVRIPGYAGGDVVPVLDCGGAIKGRRLDVLYPTHARAKRWGVQWLTVEIWEYADDGPRGLPGRR